MNNSENEAKIPNGIEMCEDECQCGGKLRLHTYTFGVKTRHPETKHYIDCSRNCGRVSGWHSNIEDAIAEIDNCMSDDIVSNSI